MTKKRILKSIGFRAVMSFSPCYHSDKLRLLFPRPRSIKWVLTNKTGPWRFVPYVDRLWCVARIGISRKRLAGFMHRCANRSIQAVKSLGYDTTGLEQLLCDCAKWKGSTSVDHPNFRNRQYSESKKARAASASITTDAAIGMCRLMGSYLIALEGESDRARRDCIFNIRIIMVATRAIDIACLVSGQAGRRERLIQIKDLLSLLKAHKKCLVQN